MPRDMKKISIMYLRSGVRDADVLLGADTVVLGIARGLDRERFNPVIVYLTDTEKQKTPILAEAAKYKIENERVCLKFKFDIIRAFLQIKNLIKKHDIDILHCQEYKSNLVGFLVVVFMKKKVITTVHGWVGCDWKVKLYEFIDSWVIRSFAKIIAVSKVMSEVLKEKKISDKKVEVINNGIDSEAWAPEREKAIIADLKSQLKIADDFAVVGTVGRLSIEKGQDIFIRAASEVFQENPRVHFIIVGDGPYLEKFKKLAHELLMAKHITFLGFKKNISEYLKMMDVFVLPSRKETFGLALLEAFYMKKPVVCTPVGIASEMVINGNNAILSEIGDIKSMSGAIISLLNDKEFASELGKKAYIKAKDCFSLKNMAESYSRLYCRLMETEDV
ncbi:MAG: glycosyltransferase family 4 protein [Candidatus Omnitrophota bacterium]